MGRLTRIPGILEEHFDEVEFLLIQREAALGSSDYTLNGIRRLEERIGAHLDALIEAGDRNGALIEAGLKEKSWAVVCTSAILALHNGARDCFESLGVRFESGSGGPLKGLAAAFAIVQSESMAPRLQSAFARGVPHVAAEAGRVLAGQRMIRTGEKRLVELLLDEDAVVRETSWRAARLIPPPGPQEVGIPEANYRAGAADEDAAVCRATLEAAAWMRQSWLLARCREGARRPKAAGLELLRFLAVLGESGDAEALLAAGKEPSLGPERFRILAMYGHPAVVPLLLEGMRDPDPVVASTAGAAFYKMTGVNVESSTRVSVPPADGREPDAFEREFLDEVKLPDVAKAGKAWEGLRERYEKGIRWCRGHEMSKPLPPEDLLLMDVESLREMAMRAAFRGLPGPTARDLEAFPMRAFAAT